MQLRGRAKKSRSEERPLTMKKTNIFNENTLYFFTTNFSVFTTLPPISKLQK